MKTPQAFLVEHYWPGVTVEAFSAATGRVQATADLMADEGVDVRYLHSTMVPGDEAAFCVFEAGALEFVAEVYKRAGVRFERIIDAVELDLPLTKGTAGCETRFSIP